MAQFSNRDPATPHFWDERFERGFTPWDRGGVPQALRDFVAASPTPLATLIPGCGAAYELAFLSEQGWDAVAIDFSPAAVATAKAGLGQWAGNVVQADFFNYLPDSQPGLIYERAFLCALPSAMWPRVAARWADLLGPGGLLVGFFFFDDADKGPPFGIGREALDDLLEPFFECVEDAAVDDSIAVFEGKERWMVWRRR
ncbi:MAG: SAM-dependent methyltransferase [Massilia sp.]|jgi:SAM-dependent methyltransferase|nr:SAM-dependent methyltransferase [Massilia sp.]